MNLCANHLLTATIGLCAAGCLFTARAALLLGESSLAPSTVPAGLANAEAASASEATPSKAAAPPFSAGVDEVLKLVRSGVGEQTILAFVESSPFGYRLSADEIIRLQKAGVPSEVTAAMIRHGSQIRARMLELLNNSSQWSQEQQPATTPSYAPVYSSPPVVYTAPQYVYPEVSYASYPTYGYLSAPDYGFIYPRSSWSSWNAYPSFSLSWSSSRYSNGRSFYAGHNSYSGHSRGNSWHGGSLPRSGGRSHGYVGGHSGSRGGSPMSSGGTRGGGGARGGRGGGPRGR